MDPPLCPQASERARGRRVLRQGEASGRTRVSVQDGVATGRRLFATGCQCRRTPVPCQCNDLWRRGTGPPGAERPPLHPREASLDERVAGVVDTVSVREAWSTGVVHVVCVGHLVRHVVAARL